MPASRPPLSGPHGASLATTAGITAVITGVLAASLLAQTSSASGPLPGVAIADLLVAIGLLYAARNAIGLALDHAADPILAGYWSQRGLRAYHAGMAALFAALATAAVWKLAMPYGLMAGAIGAALSLHALYKSLRTT